MTDFVVEQQAGGVGVIRPVGRLTMVSARQFTASVTELIAAGTVKVVVDLSETEFLDSSGLGALISGLKATRQAGGDLRLARPTEQVTTILTLTNLDQVLKPRDSVEDAY